MATCGLGNELASEPVSSSEKWGWEYLTHWGAVRVNELSFERHPQRAALSHKNTPRVESACDAHGEGFWRTGRAPGESSPRRSSASNADGPRLVPFPRCEVKWTVFGSRDWPLALWGHSLPTGPQAPGARGVGGGYLSGRSEGHGMKNQAREPGRAWRGSQGPGRHRVGPGEGPRAGGRAGGSLGGRAPARAEAGRAGERGRRR